MKRFQRNRPAHLRSPARLITCSSAYGQPLTAFMFENLEVHQQAVDFADEITTVTVHFPRDDAFLVDQLKRTDSSVPPKPDGRKPPVTGVRRSRH